MTTQQTYQLQFNAAGTKMLSDRPGVTSEMTTQVAQHIDDLTHGRWSDKGAELRVQGQAVGGERQCVVCFNPAAAQMVAGLASRDGRTMVDMAHHLVEAGLAKAEEWRPWNELGVKVVGLQPVQAV